MRSQPPGPLILASRSPQRRAILEQLGVEFSIFAPDVEELDSGPPHELAIENAYRKAAAGAAEHPASRVLGVDTIVALGSRVYGKPADRQEAGGVLRALAGRRHAVISGVCVIDSDGRARMAAASTAVSFRALQDTQIEWYLDSGEWRERAGGYAIQGRGAALVAAIEGDYLNVVGLPVPTLLDLLPDLLG
jgi:septum formation protein